MAVRKVKKSAATPAAVQHQLHFDHRTLRTPSDTINILSAGGLRMGAFAEVYGPNASGKSAFCYQMARYFQEDYPEGQVWIIDSEKSLDFVRMKHVFGLKLEPENGHVPFVVRQVSSLEQGFNTINRALADSVDADGKEKQPILVIWDTISVARPKDELAVAYGDDYDDMGINAGGLGLSARVMAHGLATSMTAGYGKPVTVLLINQVRTTGYGTWKGPTERHSSGGMALRHYVHYKIYIRKRARIRDEETEMEIGTRSEVTIDKSKFCPCPFSFPLEIYDRAGGVIVPREEIFQVAEKVGVLTNNHSWWKFNENYVGDGSKSFRRDELLSSPELRRMAHEGVTRFFRKQYFTIDKTYEEMGIETGAFENEEKQKPIDWIQANDPFARRSVPEPEEKEEDDQGE